MQEYEYLDKLFKQEFAKMVAVISSLYGLQHIELAEDIVSDTFLQATETWGIKGVPANPAAWLYVVAKQKALYYFRRNNIYIKNVLPSITAQQQTIEEAPIDFSDQNIKDSQLQMLFAVCNPAIASEAQIGLALRILCGFGIDEIAEAFFTNKETINKRLFRAKDKLRTEGITMELPPANEIANRLDNVLHVIYLLFSEGYYSKTQNEVLRKDLCLEAMRLALMLTEYDKTNLPKTNALLALMCFHASRFHARLDDNNAQILYDMQDETLWNDELINQGVHYLYLSAQGDELTSYHLEANIAYRHCIKNDTIAKWEDILQLYNQLLQVNYSPAVALNRLYALYKAKGPQQALEEAKQLPMDNNFFYQVLIGELYTTIDEYNARESFEKALAMAKTPAEKLYIQQRLVKL